MDRLEIIKKYKGKQAREFRNNPDEIPEFKAYLIETLVDMIKQQDRWLQFAGEKLIEELRDANESSNWFRVQHIRRHPNRRFITDYLGGKPKYVVARWVELCVFSNFAAGLLILLRTRECPFARKISLRDVKSSSTVSQVMDSLTKMVATIWKRRTTKIDYNDLEFDSADCYVMGDTVRWPELAAQGQELQRALATSGIESKGTGLGWDTYEGNLRWPPVGLITCSPQDAYGWGVEVTNWPMLR